MAKKVIVGGRIESKEVGGIVTGAAEILDDTKGKKQNVINQETDAELERLDGAKQDVLTFDNTPTEGSNNPVKSGGVYAAQQAILLAIAAINELIPSAASALNKLADTAFVNSSISTNTATFRGTSASGLTEQQFLAWANGLTHDLNDYVFWQTVDAAGNTLFKRYKWNGTEWAYEYTLNNSTFTAEQWEAIQSGITALLVTKLRALPTAQELIQSFDEKQDVLTFDNVPTLGSNNPVKSSGIYNVIKAITDLIPAEATAQNQLADKADVAAKIVAAIPSWKGQYDALTDLQVVTGAKAGDMGCVKTTDSDGHAVLTFYQYSAQGAWVVYYTLRHYAQNKPATTGTTGDYPYNGMGRIELQKNIVNGVNTLTQAMLTQQNTIYVIQYDFTLGEDITVPANCMLEFDGGSISANGSNDTITGTNTGINAGLVKIFNTNVTLAGSWNVVEAYPEWFGAKGDSATDDTLSIQKCINFIGLRGGKVKFAPKTYRADELVINYKSVILEGAGKANEGGKATVIQPIDTTDYVIKVGYTTGMCIGGGLRNLMISGNNTRQERASKYNCIGVYMFHIAEFDIENVFISGFTKQGLLAKDWWDSKVSGLEIRACSTILQYAALDLDCDADSTNSIHFFGLHIEECSYQLHIGNICSHIQFVACKFEIQNADYQEILESISGGNEPYSIYIYEGVYSIVFSSCFFRLLIPEGAVGLMVRNNKTILNSCMISASIENGTLIRNISKNADYGKYLTITSCEFDVTNVCVVADLSDYCIFSNNSVKYYGQVKAHSQCIIVGNTFNNANNSETIILSGDNDSLDSNKFSNPDKVVISSQKWNKFGNMPGTDLVSNEKPTINFHKGIVKNFIYSGTSTINLSSSDIINAGADSKITIGTTTAAVSIDSSLDASGGFIINPGNYVTLKYIVAIEKWTKQ